MNSESSSLGEIQNALAQLTTIVTRIAIQQEVQGQQIQAQGQQIQAQGQQIQAQGQQIQEQSQQIQEQSHQIQAQDHQIAALLKIVQAEHDQRKQEKTENDQRFYVLLEEVRYLIRRIGSDQEDFNSES
jgi:flagellar motility protein MotE (MotC chaperone)